MFGNDLRLGSNMFLSALGDQYDKCKGTEDEFEIVYMLFCENERYFIDCVSVVPWLAHPYSYTKLRNGLVNDFFYYYRYLAGELAVIAFGEDGHIQTKGVIKRYDVEVKAAFPFIDKDLKAATLEDLCKANSWGWDCY